MANTSHLVTTPPGILLFQRHEIIRAQCGNLLVEQLAVGGLNPVPLGAEGICILPHAQRDAKIPCCPPTLSQHGLRAILCRSDVF